MFCNTQDKITALSFELFRGAVVPRPIAWISTQDLDGNVNIAPYSYFNAVADNPPMLLFSTTALHKDGREKDTISNIEATGEFVVNVATYELREKMIATSVNFEKLVSEADIASLSLTASELVKPSRIKESPISLECILHQIIDLPKAEPTKLNRLVIGRVVGIHVDNGVLTNEKIDIAKLAPLGRMGYSEYASITQTFVMERPDVNHYNTP